MLISRKPNEGTGEDFLVKKSSCTSSQSLVRFIFTVFLIIFLSKDSYATSVSGVWNPSESFVKVVARFGFLKQDVHHRDKTDGYIFGNITSSSSVFSNKVTTSSLNNKSNNRTTLLLTSKASLILVDKSTFHRMFGEGTKELASGNCSQVFSAIKHLIPEEDECIRNLRHEGNKSHVNSSSNGIKSSTRDMIRFLPCPKNGSCLASGSRDSGLTSNPLPGTQFTFVITDQKQPIFWYLVLINCHRDVSSLLFPQQHQSSLNSSSSCPWTEGSKTDKTVYQYSIHLVNGKPDLIPSGGGGSSLLTHEFSYEEQDLILYLVMMSLYVTLLVFQVYAVLKQRHRNLLVFLFSTSLSMQSLSFFFSTLHKVVYAQDGVGYTTLFMVSDILRILSLGLFILFVLIIAKGWPITRAEVTGKPLLLLSWLTYVVIDLILFVWIKRSLDVVKEVDEYHTLPGWISLIFRIIIMLWFLCELRATMMLEQNQARLRFYLHFGAGIMVWFVHLPIVAMIGLQISLMWRYKLILGFSSAANFLAFAIVTHFMWPTKMSYHFLTHPMMMEGRDGMTDFSQEELEYYERDDDDCDPESESFGFYNNPNYTQSSVGNNNHNHNNSIHRSHSHRSQTPSHHRDSNSSSKTDRKSSRFSFENHAHVKT